MKTPVKHMTRIDYSKDNRPWQDHRVDQPSWNDIEAAIRKMDNDCFPIVLLSCRELDEDENGFDDEDAFHAIGGNGQFALLHCMAEWQYEDPDGGERDVRLWESDQGFFCLEKNIIEDIERVLRLVKEFYQTGSYDTLDTID
jgi:hypothetical protein